MGPSGAGKSTVGALTAELLGVPFYEGDGFHPAKNIELIRAGVPLTIKERGPWLAAIADAIARDAPDKAVLACSALNAEIRRLMEELIPARLIYALLDVPTPELLRRLQTRANHFAGPALLESQLAAMDDMEGVTRLDGTLPAKELAEQAAGLLQPV
jgi:gluconokinase